MCRAPIRVPEMWYGDYLAAFGAIRIGERRLHELAERYGPGHARAVRERVVRLLRAAHDGGDSRAAVATVDGSGRHDPLDGHPEGIPVRVGVEIDGEAGRVDG